MVEFNKYDAIGKSREEIIFTMASGPVIVKGKKVLLDKHGEDKFWNFPGGKQIDYLSPIENAITEVEAELGLEVKIIDPNPCVMVFERERNDKKEYVVLVHYLSKIVSGKPKTGRDVREYKWLDVRKLPEDVAPNIKPVLKWFGY